MYTHSYRILHLELILWCIGNILGTRMKHEMHHAHDLFGCRSSTDDGDDDDDACYSSPIVIVKLVILHS